MRALILRSLRYCGLSGLLLFGVLPAAAQTGQVLLYGVAGELADNARAALDMDQFDCATPQWRLQRNLRQAPQRIARALRALGYYDAAVTDSQLERSGDCWRASFDIEPGQPVKIEQLNVSISGEAEDEAAFRSLLNALPLQTGADLHHGRYEQTKRAILDLGIEMGYFDGALSRSVMRVDPAAHRAEIDIAYVSGPRYNFGEVEVEQDILDPDFVGRYIDIKAGDPYNGQALSSLYQGLADSGYFGDVQVRPEVDRSGTQRVPVDLKLKARARHTHSFGIGAATDTGPRIRYGYVDRRINRFGHRLDGSIEVSAVGSEFGTEYRIPADDPRNEWFSLTAANKTEITDTSETSRAVIGVSRTRKLTRWLETTFVELQRETFDVGEQSETTNILMPGIHWVRTRADDPTFPRRGYMLSLDLSGANADVFSDLSFVQARLHGKRIWPLFPRTRLLVRLEVGVTELDQFTDLPASLRFFAGGDNSIRGYAYESLGPVDSSGKVVGGRHLAVGSVEADWLFTERWSVAAFIDEGNAVNNANDDLVTGVGFGFRWRSPIGPIRFDLAKPLDDPETDFRFHLSMGLDL